MCGVRWAQGRGEEYVRALCGEWVGESLRRVRMVRFRLWTARVDGTWACVVDVFTSALARRAADASGERGGICGRSGDDV